ncbi:MAG: YbhN family protein [Roseburia sp.]|nr:flippase-like domain-containing protein [Lachnospiraceae bacterium]
MKRDKKKTIIKFIFVIAILAAIIYTFRDSAGPILEQLKKTSPLVLVVICLLSVCYELVEGWITYSFAKHYNPKIRYKDGVESAFYCSFYRVATLGSGAGVAAIYYFHEKGIEYSESTGMYMIEYVVHKISIALLSVVLLIFNFTFLRENYGNYMWMLVLGYGITIVIAFFLILFCCSKKFHWLIIWSMERINTVMQGKLETQLGVVREYCEILEQASRKLLKDKKMLVFAVLKNFLKFGFWYSIPFFVLGEAGGMTLFQVMSVVSLAVMLAAVIPAPAGIGSTEFVFTMLFAVMIGTGLAGSTSLLYRFATFVVPFLIGAVVAINHQRRKRRQGK